MCTVFRRSYAVLSKPPSEVTHVITSRSGITLCALLLLATSACEVVDRVRNRGADAETPDASATAGALSLGLQVPGRLGPGSEGTVRLSLTNRGDSVPRGIRLELLVPGWMQLAPPRPGEREVTMAAADDEGTRFSYRMDDPPLRPGETQWVEQRIRFPAAGPLTQGAQPWGRLIRARLIGADGEPLAQVESEVELDSTVMARAVGPGQASAAQRDVLGPARLGMPAAELRQAVRGARDTTWSQEGTTERGLVIPLERGGRALAVLSGDSVRRIEVRDSIVRTREGLRVGSRLEELRAAYGRACAGIGEGVVVVWFPAAPGISFALDTPFADVDRLRDDPERIPGTARVTRWWLRRGTDSCN